MSFIDIQLLQIQASGTVGPSTYLYMWGNNTFGLLGDNRASNTYFSWTSISSGGSHTSAIRSDGTLWAWGLNTSGQLGDGTTTNKSSPVQVGTSSWISVSSGGYHTLALNTNSILYTWGLNSYGQLGDGTTVSKSYPSLVYLNNISFTSISAGAFHSLALATNSVLYSWGDNESGQLGDGTSVYRSSPVQIGSYTQIDAGKFHSSAIDSSSKLYTWGANPYSQLGQSDTVYRSSPTQLGASNWIAVAGGGGHTLAINSNNQLFAWGNDAFGQVGDNPTYSGSFWTKIVNGPNHLLALRSDGKLFARGLNTSGQLGDGTTVNRSSIVQIGSGTWSDISAGYDHSLALSTNGTLWSWGNNLYGQLNQQDTTMTYETSRSWITFSRGGNQVGYVLGIKSDNTLWAWGRNEYGQLGIGGTTWQSSPVQVGTSSWSSVTTVPATYTTLAIDTSGRLWGWGYNPDGQIPGGTGMGYLVPIGSNIDVPVLLTLNGKLWSQVEGGLVHAIGLSDTGTPYAWGYNSWGQLMQGDTLSRSSPVGIATASLGAKWVSAGADISAVIRTDGKLLLAGFNDSGVLGNNTIISRSSQVQVTASGSSWTQVTCGNNYAAAIDINSKLYVWGEDSYGVLGQMAFGNRSTPSQITSVINDTYNDFATTSWTSIYAGYYTLTATDSNGRVFFWGRNDLGQLGDGSSTNKSFPIQITSDYSEVWPQGTATIFKKSNGYYYATGSNDTGIFGNGIAQIADISSPVLALAGRVPNIYNRSSPAQVGTGTWSQITAGLYNSFGINSTNNMFGWGINTTGKIGGIDIVGYSWKSMAGSSHTVAIRSDNTLWAWGSNSNGQLGLNISTTISRSSPAIVGSETETSWSQVSAGANHTMAIKTDGSLWAWGLNGSSQLSDLSYTILDAGTDHAISLRNDGRIFFTGSLRNNKGGINANRSYPVQVATTVTNFTKIIATDQNTLALDSEGILYTVGAFRNGQNVAHPAVLQYWGGTAEASKTNFTAIPMTLFDNTPLKDIFPGFRQTYFLDILNRVWMVGDGRFGDGNNTALKRFLPELLGSTTTTGTYSLYFQGLTSSRSPMFPSFSGASMNLTGNFTIECWIFQTSGDYSIIYRGNNTGDYNITLGFTNSYGAENCLYGTVVIGGVTYGGRFTAVGSTSPQYANGVWHHIALVRYLSSNLYGYIDGVRQGVSYTGVTGTIDLSSTNNYIGPLGGDAGYGGFISNFRVCSIAVYNSTSYTKPTGPFSATQAANPFGGSGTAAITGTQCLLLTYQDAIPTDNSTFAQAPAYGDQSCAEPGLDWWIPMTNFSPFNNITHPVTNTSYLQLSSGYGHTLGIQTDYTLWGWGLNSSGQLGLNDRVNRSSPIQIGTSSWSIIATGMYHSAGITVDNNLFIWGNNEFGQLGLNDKIFRSNPVQITSPATSWTMVETKYYHTVATASDNSTYGWGNNIFQQLGPNAGTISYVQISSGIANTNRGEALGWGWNYYMRFGIAEPYVTSGAINAPWSHPVQIQTNISDVSWSYANSSAYIPNNYWGKTMFVRTDGTLWGIGQNQYGDLGLGDTVARSSPTQIGSDTNWSFVLSGSNRSTFAIKTDGTLWSWGFNQAGVATLGLGNTIDRSSPVQIPGSWSMVSPGYNHTLAIKTDGTLWGWGGNTGGQLGTSDRSNRSSPVQITTDTYIDIAAGLSFSLAVPSSGILLAWGNNNAGQLGTEDAVARSSPTQIGLMNTWTKVSASYMPHSLGLNGVNLYAWGYNNNGELGVNDTISRSSPVQVTGGHSWLDMDAESISAAIRTDHTIWTWGAGNRTGIITNANRSAPTQILNNNTVNVLSPILITTSPLSSISTGYTMTYLQYPNSGGIESMGFNGTGQLGVNTTVNRSTPTQIYNIGSTINRSSPVQLGSMSWTSIAAGTSSSMGITTNGMLYAWGGNSNGQLGDGTTINKSYLVPIGSSGWTAIDTALQTLGLKGSALYVWGYNNYGQLGLNDANISRSSPVQISGSYTKISTGSETSYAIDSTNLLLAWGRNDLGQIGDSSFINRSSPVQVGSFTTVRGNTNYALAEKSDGTLWSWGYNVYGQLGVNDILNRSSPVQVGSYKILGGGPSAYATAISTPTDGFAFMAGLATSNQLGNGSVSNKSSPTQVYATAPESSYRGPVKIGLSSWTYVAAGISHTMAVKTDNTLWAWGLGTSGQLGNTATTSRSSPVQVSIASNTFSKLAPGDLHSMVLTSNSSLWAWGVNTNGQLGINTVASRSSPVQVSGVFADVGSGASHTIALTPDGTLWTWGANSLNQLGNGDTIDRSSPVQLPTNSLTSNARYDALSTYQDNSVALNMAGDIFGWGTSTFVNGSSPVIITASDAVNYIVSSPVQIGTSSWSAVSAGENFSTGLQYDGTVESWGRNEFGQLGLNDTLNRSSPVQVGSDTYSAISAGYDFNALRKSDGKTYLFGKNDVGQVGDLT